VKTVILRLVIGAGTLAAVLSFAATPSRAGLYGDEQWCAVQDNGAGELTWDCEFLSLEDCRPAVLAGNKGFCALNPYYRAPDPTSDPQR
jgi:hypothetical protein